MQKTSCLIGGAWEVQQAHAELVDHGVVVGRIVGSHTQDLKKVSTCYC